MIVRLTLLRLGSLHVGIVTVAGTPAGVFAYRRMRGFKEWIWPAARPLVWAEEVNGTLPRGRHLRVVKVSD